MRVVNVPRANPPEHLVSVYQQACANEDQNFTGDIDDSSIVIDTSWLLLKDKWMPCVPTINFLCDHVSRLF